MGRNWQISKLWSKLARPWAVCPSIPCCLQLGLSPIAPGWNNPGWQITGCPSKHQSEDREARWKQAWTALCHHWLTAITQTLYSLPRDCHHPACMMGWPSSESSQARCNTVPCCHGYLAISPEWWHQCLRGARALLHAYAWAQQEPCHIWASYNIFSRKWIEKEGKVT